MTDDDDGNSNEYDEHDGNDDDSTDDKHDNDNDVNEHGGDNNFNNENDHGADIDIQDGDNNFDDENENDGHTDHSEDDKDVNNDNEIDAINSNDDDEHAADTDTCDNNFDDENEHNTDDGTNMNDEHDNNDNETDAIDFNDNDEHTDHAYANDNDDNDDFDTDTDDDTDLNDNDDNNGALALALEHDDDDDDSDNNDDKARRLILRDVGKQIDALMFPVEPVIDRDVHPSSPYDALMHAKLCRFRCAGLTLGECAKAAGISPTTLSNWLKRYPRLEADLDRALALSTTRAAMLLQGMMTGNDAVAFQAVKFFLTSRSSAFRERAPKDNAAAKSARDVAVFIRETVFGITEHENNNNDGDRHLQGQRVPRLLESPAQTTTTTTTTNENDTAAINNDDNDDKNVQYDQPDYDL